jgi:hypothetical protein
MLDVKKIPALSDKTRENNAVSDKVDGKRLPIPNLWRYLSVGLRMYECQNSRRKTLQVEIHWGVGNLGIETFVIVKEGMTGHPILSPIA